MKFDDILVRIGEFGFYQRRLYLILCIPAISTGCYMMMLVYTMYTPDHRSLLTGWCQQASVYKLVLTGCYY